MNKFFSINFDVVAMIFIVWRCENCAAQCSGPTQCDLQMVPRMTVASPLSVFVLASLICLSLGMHYLLNLIGQCRTHTFLAEIFPSNT